MACPFSGNFERMRLVFCRTARSLAQIYEEANREEEEYLPKAVLKLHMTCQQQRTKPVKKIYSSGQQDRGSGMTLDGFNFSPHHLVFTALLATSSCPISHFGAPPPLTGYSFAGSCCLVLSFCLSALLSLLQTPVFGYFVRLHLPTIGCSRCPGCTNLSQCCFLLPNETLFTLQTCHVKLCMYALSCKANKSVLFLHSWWLCQKPQQQKAL